MNNDRLAVLIGSQSRGLPTTSENVNFFLELFDIPYDVFVCSDESDLDNFDSINNITHRVSLEQIEQNNEWLASHKEKMHKHYWQNAKLFGVSTIFEDVYKQYTHAIKMRTDFMFDYRSYFTDNGLDPDNINHVHLKHIQEDIRIHRHHCNVKESRKWKSMYTDDTRIVPFLWNGDRFIFSAADVLHMYCREIMKTAANVEKIYTTFYKIPMHPNFMNVHEHLETISIPHAFFPDRVPNTGAEIAEYLNSNKHVIKEFNKQKMVDSSFYEPIISKNHPRDGKSFFCGGTFNADCLAFINQLFVPFIKPSKQGIVKYMWFTRWGDNDRVSKTTRSTIKQAFHDDDVSYRDSITIQNKLIKIKNANIT